MRRDTASRVEEEKRAHLLQLFVIDAGQVGVPGCLAFARRGVHMLVDPGEHELVGVEGGRRVLLQHLGRLLGPLPRLVHQQPPVLPSRGGEKQCWHDQGGHEQRPQQTDGSEGRRLGRGRRRRHKATLALVGLESLRIS